MSNKLNLQVTLSAIDKLTAPFRNASTGVQKLTDSIKTAKSALRDLENTQNKMRGFSRTSEQIKKSTDIIGKHNKKLENLRNKVSLLKNERIDLKVAISEKEREFKSIAAGGKVSWRSVQLDFDLRKMQKEYEKLQQTISATNRQITNESNTVKASRREKAKQLLQLRELNRVLKKNGINTKELAKHETDIKSKIDAATSALERQNKTLEKASILKARHEKYRTNVDKIRSTSERLQNLGQRSMMTGAAISAPVIGMGRGVVGMAQTAGQFEKFQSILEITEGSSEKAQQSLKWVQKFAQDTPSNLDETMEAFVRLRAYGMDPTNGLLQTLGDTGAAMGKPVIQAVEAIADAVTGENERLKEFGIKGRAVKGSNIIEYEYTDKNGRQQLAKVNKHNRKQIEQTLTAIFNNKYAGAMEKQAKTLTGIWAKLEDYWTNFQMKIMQTGAFDWIKNKLQGVLNTLDSMDKNGELQQWAEDIGGVILEVAQGLWQFGEQLSEAIKAIAQFAKENKGVIATFVKWAAVIGSSLTVFGALSMMMSFILYPIVRLAYGFSNLIGLNTLLSTETRKSAGELLKNNKQLFSYKNTINGLSVAKTTLISKALELLGKIKKIPSATVAIIGKMKTLSFWFNVLKTIGRVAFSPIRIAVLGIGAALSFLFSPIGLLTTALIGSATYIYKNWEKVRSFFGGFWEGLKSGLAPVIKRFKPLGDLIGVVVGWIEQAVKWFTDLLGPIESTQKELDEAAVAGKKFGEWLAAGIDLVTKPMQWLMESIKWVIDNMPKMDIASPSKTIEKIQQKHGVSSTTVASSMTGLGAVNSLFEKTKLPEKPKWSGGYAGNGGKYEPKGIYHGGEYIMTKEATSRLGVPLLNALNYGKKAVATSMLGLGVATAQPANIPSLINQIDPIQKINIESQPPIKIDSRPPLTRRPSVTQQAEQAMTINITVNAAQGQDERTIARMVAQELQRMQQQKQARMRSRMTDKD